VVRSRSKGLAWTIALGVGLALAAPGVPAAAAAADEASLSSDPGELVNMGGTLFFAAGDGIHGRELWRSDGSLAGTVLVKDIRPGPRGGAPEDLTAIGGALYFTADDGVHGWELWRSDGTDAGTTLVADIRPGSAGSPPSGLSGLHGAVLFWADDGSHGREPWRSDGTKAGTGLIKDIRPGSAGSEPGAPWGGQDVAGGLFHFAADDGRHGEEPWVSDGTAAGTRLVKDLAPGRGDSLTAEWAALGDIVMFASNGVLWRSDGTAEGTSVVKRIPFPDTGVVASMQPEGLTAAGGRLYFLAPGEAGAPAIWTSDGTTAGTREIHELRTFSPWMWKTPLGLMFTDGPVGTELWKSDGTAAGTRLVRRFHPSSDEAGPDGLAAVGVRTFFRADDGGTGPELWTSDRTAAGTTLVLDIDPGPVGSLPASLTAIGRQLYFSADDGRHGNELWRSDGTPEGTVMVSDIHALDPHDRCTGDGGTVQVRRATWGTSGSPDSRVDLGRSVELCRFGPAPGTRRTTSVDLGTLASQGPTLASTAYLAREPRSPRAGAGTPAARYCTQLGGTTSFGDTGTAGGWVAREDPREPVVSMCVFADGSMIDAPSLLSAASGTLAGADLAPLFAYQPGVLPALFRGIR
jgi:ELWxxDGT repeat protein